MTVSTLGIIGSGNIGAAVARLAVAAGVEVVLANSRGAASLADLVDELGPAARAGTVTEAANVGPVVLLSIPITAYRALPEGLLANKTVLDTGNYYPSRDGRIPELDSRRYTQLEFNQSLLPGASLVKAFNNILAHHIPQLARSADESDRSALPIAGADPSAVRIASAFVDRLGFDTVDAGPPADTWRFEPESAGYTQIYLADPATPLRDYMSAPAAPLSASQLRAALASATPVDVAARQF